MCLIEGVKKYEEDCSGRSNPEQIYSQRRPKIKSNGMNCSSCSEDSVADSLLAEGE